MKERFFFPRIYFELHSRKIQIRNYNLSNLAQNKSTIKNEQEGTTFVTVAINACISSFSPFLPLSFFSSPLNPFPPGCRCRKQDCGITRSEISQESYLLSPAGGEEGGGRPRNGRKEQSPTNSTTLITGIRTIRFSALLSPGEK